VAILDVFRRMAGLETVEAAAAAERQASEHLKNRTYAGPVDFFAANAAMALRTASDDVLRRKLPEVSMIADGRIPARGSRRELHISKAAEAHGRHYAVSGDNHGMGAALGEAVRLRALDTVNMRGLSDDGSPSLVERIQARTAAAALATETYMGVGATHERAISAAAMGCEHSIGAKPLHPARRAAAERVMGPLDAERFAHVGPVGHEPAGSNVSIRRAVLAYEVAQARIGVLPPSVIVERADATAIGDVMRGIAQSPKPGETLDHVRPDFGNVGMDERSARYVEMIASQFRETSGQLKHGGAEPGVDMARNPERTMATVNALAWQRAGRDV